MTPPPITRTSEGGGLVLLCAVESCGRKVRCKGLCNRHYSRMLKRGTTAEKPKPTVEERFWAKVDRSNGATRCWLWTASTNTSGYGKFSNEGRVLVPAHRFSYELLIGPIAPGLHIDHLCRTPRCVNPAHLEPVTPRENAMRGVAPLVAVHRSGRCSKGHPMTPENTYVNPSNGHRRCRQCLSAYSASRRRGVANA